MTPITGAIKRRYPVLKGKDWIRKIEPDDRKALLHVVRSFGEHGRKGGRARAATAQRDSRGRFI